MATLSKNTQEKIRALLRVKKENLEKELSAFATKDPKVKDDWDSTYPRIPEASMEETANEVEAYSTTLPIEHSLELQLRNVNNALERMQRGNYGTCEKCQKQMSEERLLAMPEAMFCADCAI